MDRAFLSVYDAVTEDFTETRNKIIDHIKETRKAKLSVEEIQDIIESKLMCSKYKDVAKAYIKYRVARTNARTNTIDKVVSEIVGGTSEYWKDENSNKNAELITTQRDYIAGAVSTDQARRYILPPDIVEAHDNGLIHVHDMDYLVTRETNCNLCNLEDMLQNGTIISGTLIEKPHKFSTACNIATQIVAQVSSSQFGGQTITLSHLSPFVEESRKTFKKQFPKIDDETLEQMIAQDIRAGMQTLQYQILTLMTTNGQAPFITVFMYINEVEEAGRKDLCAVIEETLRQRIAGVKNEVGVPITPAFPKLIYVLDENNIYPNSPYYYLTELAAECTAKRMVPDYISAKIMKQLKNGDVYPCMGCRSFLTVDTTKDHNYARAKNFDKHNGHKYYGRFNAGVVTLNLVDVALSSKQNMDEFWRILDERLELCHRALQVRHKRLRGVKSDVAPILWQNGALARLNKGETIDELLFHNYSTLSLGYCGLYETVKYMTGVSHTDECVGKPFGLDIMQKLNDACAKWRADEDIAYSVYGTPLESSVYKFASKLRERFGIIKDVTDHTYITNSYHVNVREKIDIFDKLKIESEFQKLSPGGTIIYGETSNLANNIPVVLKILNFIYDTALYAELNSKFDYCQACGYSGEINIKGDPGHLYWECPSCGNTDKSKMNVARRTCGYIGSNFWNQGRTEEIKDRVLHLDTQDETL